MACRRWTLHKFTLLLVVATILARILIWDFDALYGHTDQIFKDFPVLNTGNIYGLEYLHEIIHTSRTKSLYEKPQFTLPPKGVSQGVTVVTAYFNIGRFRKDENFFRCSFLGQLLSMKCSYFTPDLYLLRMRSFSKIKNPVVAFFDDVEFEEAFLKLRSKLPAHMTQTYLVSRNKLWAFKILPTVKGIFDSLLYPDHHPNTVVPGYSCSMHAKYELAATVSEINPYNTKYIAWLDIGYFRNMANLNDTKDPPFELVTLPDMDDSRISYGQIFPLKRTNSAHIFRHNELLYGGGLFVGTTSLIPHWTKQYIYYTEKYLEMGLANTDQQVLYAMELDSLGEARAIRIQPYKHIGSWLGLGHRMKEHAVAIITERYTKQIAPSSIVSDKTMI